MCGRQRQKASFMDSGLTKNSSMEQGNLKFNNQSKKGYLICFTCNSVYTDKSQKYCKNCGEKFIKCPISKRQFRTGQNFAQCENCLSLFHYHHLKDWINSNRHCPICREKMETILSGTVGMHSILS